MSTESITALERAERCKEKGNACFKKDKFSAAIEAYTEVRFAYLMNTTDV